MEFIYYKNCSTCRKAKQWLDATGLSYQAREIKENPPTNSEITQWLETANRPIKSFFNTSGKLYREQGLKDKLPQMNQKEIINVLASDPMMVKRPILITDEGRVLSGFKENEWEDALKI